MHPPGCKQRGRLQVSRRRPSPGSVVSFVVPTELHSCLGTTKRTKVSKKRRTIEPSVAFLRRRIVLQTDRPSDSHSPHARAGPSEPICSGPFMLFVFFVVPTNCRSDQAYRAPSVPARERRNLPDSCSLRATEDTILSPCQSCQTIRRDVCHGAPWAQVATRASSQPTAMTSKKTAITCATNVSTRKIRRRAVCCGELMFIP